MSIDIKQHPMVRVDVLTYEGLLAAQRGEFVLALALYSCAYKYLQTDAQRELIRRKLDQITQLLCGEYTNKIDAAAARDASETRRLNEERERAQALNRSDYREDD